MEKYHKENGSKTISHNSDERLQLSQEKNTLTSCALVAGNYLKTEIKTAISRRFASNNF